MVIVACRDYTVSHEPVCRRQYSNSRQVISIVQEKVYRKATKTGNSLGGVVSFFYYKYCINEETIKNISKS